MSENNKNNQYLMFKQGIKGVFSFKIQFIIILILTFMASLILTVSTTTNRRLSYSYNRIVNSLDKFDLTWNLNTGKSQMSDRETAFIPILDLIGISDSYIKSINDSDYNVVWNMNEANGSVNNFLTRLVENSTEFRNGYSLVWDGMQSARNTEDYNSHAFSQKIALTNIFAKAFFEDLLLFQEDSTNADVLYLNTTVFGKYTLLNNNWWTEYANDSNNYDYNSVYSLISANPTDQNAKYTGLVYYGCHSLSERIGYLIGFYNNLFTSSVNGKFEMYEFIFGTKYNQSGNAINENYIGGYEKDLTNVSFEQLEQNNELYFFIDNRSNFNSEYSTNINSELLKKGFKGNANVAILNINSFIENEEEKNIVNQSEDLPFLTEYQELRTFTTSGWAGSREMNSSFIKYLSVFQNENYFMLPYESWRRNFFGYEGNLSGGNVINVQQTRGAYFLFHQQIVSEISGYDLYTRKELFYNDAGTQKKYRAIILEENQMTNFEILKGTMPSANNQIAISMQFAKENNIKIGQQLKIGNGLFLVSGFAVDTYSFYPSADPLIPLPKSETDAIIYGSSNTLSLISKNSDEESSVASLVTQSFNFINTSKNKNLTEQQLNAKRNNYIIYNNASYIGVKENADLLNDPSAIESNVSAKSYFKVKEFKDSTYRFNWTLYKTIFYTYSTVTYITSALIGIIALASLIVCVNKTIKANSKQIGILKALGVESSQISIAYISYAVFIAFLAVPLGWLVGTVLQYPMLNIFSNYFSFDTNGLFVDWIGVLIAFLGFGILAAIVGYITAYIQTNKPVLEITLNKNKWNRSRVLEFFKTRSAATSSIQFRLSLQLTSSGIRSITLLIISVFISSFLISLGLSIPSIALYAKDTYFENTKYRNSFLTKNPVGNSPQSKDGIVFWQGQDILTDSYIKDDSIQLGSDSRNYDGYYNNPNLYTATTNNASILPSLQYTNVNEVELINSLWQNAVTGNGGVDVIKAILASSTNNMFFPQGVSFSLGNIDQFYAFGLNAKELETKHGIISKRTSDRDRVRLANKMSEGLDSALPTILKTIKPDLDIGDANWKEGLIGLLAGFAPSFIQSYINTDSRYEQFALGMGTTTYVAGEETLATVFNAQTQNHGQVKVTGLDASQNAYKISDVNKNNVFFNDDEGYEVVIKIQQILNNQYIDNSDIFYKNLKIWDNSSKTLTIPSLNNQQANASYSMKKGDSFENVSTTSEQLRIYSEKNQQNTPLPNGAWAYNDTDYVISSSDYSKFSSLDGNTISSDGLHQNLRTNLNPYGYESVNGNWFLDPSTLQTGKYTVNLQYELDNRQSLQAHDTDYSDTDGSFISSKWNGINNLAYMFGDFKYDDDGKIESSFIRPYYEYKNLELYIPVEFAIGDEIGISAGSLDKSQDGKYMNELNYSESSRLEKYLSDNLSERYNSRRRMYLSQIARVVDYNNVPNSVKKSWGNEYDNKLYLVINPYDTRMTSQGGETLPSISDGMQNGDITTYTDGSFQWIIHAFIGGIIDVDGSSQVSYGQANNINLKSVGTIDTYGSKTVIIDSDIANILKGWPISRAFAYDYSLFDLSTEESSRDGTFNVYDLNDFTSQMYSNDWQKNSYLNYMNSDNIQIYSPHNYFNTILSKFNEPLAVTSSATMVKTGYKDGIISIYDSTSTLKEYGIINFNFLSEEIALMNEIAGVAASIAILIITVIAVASALLIMLVGDIYIAQYKRFIVMLRSFGYSNQSIMAYVLGTVSVISLMAWAGATVLIWVEMYSIILIIGKMGFAIPFGIKWWAIAASFAIMLISYAGSLMVSSRAARKEPVASMMSATIE